MKTIPRLAFVLVVALLSAGCGPTKGPSPAVRGACIAECPSSGAARTVCIDDCEGDQDEPAAADDDPVNP